jgi:hypothetical protein
VYDDCSIAKGFLCLWNHEQKEASGRSHGHSRVRCDQQYPILSVATHFLLSFFFVKDHNISISSSSQRDIRCSFSSVIKKLRCQVEIEKIFLDSGSSILRKPEKK